MANAKVKLRELKLHANEIVHSVEEERAVYEVTIDGEATAILEPVTQEVDRATLEKIWTERRRLAQEFGKNWNGRLTVLEAVSQQRR